MKPAALLKSPTCVCFRRWQDVRARSGAVLYKRNKDVLAHHCRCGTDRPPGHHGGRYCPTANYRSSTAAIA
eukprot:9468973-Prorocentrum_lima.AAC.1